MNSYCFLLVAATQCYSVRPGQELQSGGFHVREAGENWFPFCQAQLSGWYDGNLLPLFKKDWNYSLSVREYEIEL